MKELTDGEIFGAMLRVKDSKTESIEEASNPIEAGIMLSKFPLSEAIAILIMMDIHNSRVLFECMHLAQVGWPDGALSLVEKCILIHFGYKKKEDLNNLLSAWREITKRVRKMDIPHLRGVPLN